MPLVTIEGTELGYYFVACDKYGNERSEDGVRLSSRIRHVIETEPITDVFIFSHGWKGDITSAREQYDQWVRCMAQSHRDLARIRERQPNFKPLLVGFHWPSLPWGNEELEVVRQSFAPTTMPTTEALIAAYVDRIADTPAAQAAIRTVVEYAAQNIAPPTLPPEIREAYTVIDQESGLASEGVAAAPGRDRASFDPNFLYGARLDMRVSFGANPLGGAALFPLRQISFWCMKDRARLVGEKASHELLELLQSARVNPSPRFHLMGHSFGSIVISGMLTGSDRLAPAASVALVQGALSIWSFCSDIPQRPGTPGYFHSILRDGRVQGPLLTTRSRLDTAVCRLYPLAAGVARQVRFAPGELPLYGAVGEFGLHGPGVDAIDLAMQGTDAQYDFLPGKVYNLEASTYIRDGAFPSGAHNDIAKPEVAHAIWEAAFPSS